MRERPDSIEDLYRLYAPAAFRRARRMLGDEADAHEVVQDVFVALLRRPEQHLGQGKLSTFLYSAVTHACLNRIRSRRTRARLSEQAHRSLEKPTPLDAEQRLVLEHALRDLPDRLAQVAVYHYMDELTQDEIGQILGCSRRQVGKLLTRLAQYMVAKEVLACS